jgi:guanosine-3',5'-bis(diphosphate) 3'-pyrophosphohydrolase
LYIFESLNQLIQKYLPEDQIKRLVQAYLVARDAHEGQTRSSGEPYITHPVAVACILAEMRLDHETLMAALLHDVIEDTPATYQDMEQLFGKSVARQAEIPRQKRSPSGELPQDDYGDGARHPRHFDQTG